ncbi:hypothetical protein MPER_06697, partial [Moniliophthora perniciosa FA553]
PVPHNPGTLAQISSRNYRHALDELERLVVQRLFELTKLNMSGVGYKQREKITKALKARAEAIRRALETYNTAAETVFPPRRKLTWNEIVEMVTLADFDLLKDTHTDLAKLPWAQTTNRQAMNYHFRLRRAKEEIERLNIEIKRLITFMLDDYADFQLAIQKTSLNDPDLSAELSRQLQHRLAINSVISQRLVQTSRLKGFTGSLAARRAEL